MVECAAGEKPLGKAPFEVALNPAEVEDGGIRVEAVRIFPVQEKLPPHMMRQYTTSPPVVLSHEPEPTWAGGFSAGAMGWEQPGNWSKGVYTISCAIYGQPVAVDRFVLE